MNEWISEFPTVPGYYWIRNYLRHVAPKWQQYQEIETTPTIVEVTPDLEYYWTGSEVSFERTDLISAEWYGPIKPPE